MIRGVAVIGRAFSGFGRSTSGQGLIEFALVLPFLLALLVGAVELGQAWRSSQAVTHAAREGARLSVIPTSTNAAVTERVRETLRAGALNPSLAQLELRRRTGPGTLDTVSVSYPFQFRLLRPAVQLMGGQGSGTVPGSIWLRSTFVMRNE